MNLVKLEISNLDLAFTIDTYGMFNGDGVDESEVDYYTEEYKLTPEEAQQIDFDYNHAGIVEALASASVNILENELGSDPVVKSISLPVKTRSPQFYNYTTDSYTAEYEIDLDALLKYANSHQAEFGKHIEENWREFVNVPQKITAEYLQADDDKFLVAMLDLYLRDVVDVESYEMQMFEAESGAYYENMKPTAEFQKLLDKKEAQNA